MQDSSSAETDSHRTGIGDPAGAPPGQRAADLSTPEAPTAEESATRGSESAYGALLVGPWQAESRGPVETLAERILQSMRQPVVVLDADLRVCFANRAFCEAFQFAPGQTEGRWFPELGVGNRHVPRLRELLERALIQDGQIEAIDIEHDVPMLDRRSLLIHARKLAGPSAGDALILLEIEDVTEREHTERQRRELIATAVHELRTPLTAIKGYAQLMKKRQRTSETALSTILEQAQQMSRLIDDLLARSIPELAQPGLQPRLTDLGALARASAEQAQLLGPGHLIRVEVPERPLLGLWDGDRLAQVFANLLGNAIKYSPAGGEIVVRLQDLGPTVRASVSDQGVGIAADALPRVFGQFYRVAVTADHVPGLGLGLHVSKKLVEAHGGSISVQSILGVGSAFVIELPRFAPALATRSSRLLLETTR